MSKKDILQERITNKNIYIKNIQNVLLLGKVKRITDKGNK